MSDTPPPWNANVRLTDGRLLRAEAVTDSQTQNPGPLLPGQGVPVDCGDGGGGARFVAAVPLANGRSLLFTLGQTALELRSGPTALEVPLDSLGQLAEAVDAAQMELSWRLFRKAER